MHVGDWLSGSKEQSQAKDVRRAKKISALVGFRFPFSPRPEAGRPEREVRGGLIRNVAVPSRVPAVPPISIRLPPERWIRPQRDPARNRAAGKKRGRREATAVPHVAPGLRGPRLGSGGSGVGSPRCSDADFIINFRVTGKTGGCEQKFLEDVSKCLSLQGISLRVEEFTETSRHLLLVFCPIASNMANDTENVLAGLHGKQKVLLVVMHYVRKDNTETSVDPKQKVTHPALVRTVHTRYTLQDGFYPCEMNAVAVADVAAAIKDLAGDN
ncbi:hypothetical protein JRQ81_005423 [Phrynocephalus forsythii]|uniref:Uncharacterized protein n=1 Tax=Phrynocephalus forsythii TaxID=171643 RepID=A0A9Q0Y2W0_9SAUR|nr:hypothetical protein JRQ81_005423 [Phrynocephalus forsythii]